MAGKVDVKPETILSNSAISALTATSGCKLFRQNTVAHKKFK